MTELTPTAEFVFEVDAAVDPPIVVGTLPGGMVRRIVPVGEGTVRGPEINGRVVPGGKDWQLIWPDGTAEIEARYTIVTDRGELISVSNPGFRHAEPDIMKKLVAGEPVPPDSYYFRTAPRFETGAPRLAWMMRTIFVCVGIREPDRVRIRFFKV